MNSFRHGIEEENENKLIYDKFDCSQNESTRQNLSGIVIIQNILPPALRGKRIITKFSKV